MAEIIDFEEKRDELRPMGVNYDPVQFVKDCSNIRSYLGTRRPHGFVTLEYYEDDVIVIEETIPRSFSTSVT